MKREKVAKTEDVTMKRKKSKNMLDEMQEQKLLQIEHNGCWFAFWGLAIALTVQTCIGTDIRSVAGEWIVFMCLSMYLAIACLKNGIWDRKLAPTPKVNLCVCIPVGIVAGGIQFYISYSKYHVFPGSVAAGCFIFGVTVIVGFGTLSAASMFYRKRVSQLESEDEAQSNRGKGD